MRLHGIFLKTSVVYTQASPAKMLDICLEMGEIVYLQTARWRAGWNHEVHLFLFL